LKSDNQQIVTRDINFSMVKVRYAKSQLNRGA